jgi:hypothetical protein
MLASTGCLFRKKADTNPAGPSQFEQLLREAERVVAYSDFGLRVADELKASGLLDGIPHLEEAYSFARSSLVEMRDYGQPFLDLVRAVKDFDTTDKTALRESFEKVKESLKQLRPKTDKFIELMIEYLNKKGVTNVDVETLPSKLAIARSFIDAGIKVIESRLKD